MSWTNVALGEVIEVIMGQSPESNTYNEIGEGLPFFQGKTEFGFKHPVVKKHCSKPIKIAKANDILLSVRAPVGATNIANETCCIGRGLAAIRQIEGKSSYLYIYYFLKYKQKHIESLGVGSTFQAISKTDITNLSLMIPNVKLQTKITSVLVEAESLIQKRKVAISKLDGLIESIFFEMVGDPLRNTKGFKILTFEDVCEIKLGKMLDSKKINNKKLFKYLGNKNVRWGHFDLDDLKEMSYDEKERSTFSLKKGDLLICEGGEVGRAAIWGYDNIDIYYQKALHRARIRGSKATPEYLLQLLYFYSNNNGFKVYQTSATIAHLTQEKLKTLKIPVPPFEIQNKFSIIFNEIKLQKEVQIKSLTLLEDNFQSLLQRAFSGQLELK